MSLGIIDSLHPQFRTVWEVIDFRGKSDSLWGTERGAGKRAAELRNCSVAMRSVNYLADEIVPDV